MHGEEGWQLAEMSIRHARHCHSPLICAALSTWNSGVGHLGLGVGGASRAAGSREATESVGSLQVCFASGE